MMKTSGVGCQVSGVRLFKKLFTIHFPLVTRHSSLVTRKSGFTLIETIIVMVIMAILAAVVAVRWSPFDTIKLNNATRKVAADIRYAQKLAISTQQRCGVFRNSATSYTVFEQGSTADPAPSPGDVCSTAPDGADADTTSDFIVDTSQDRCSDYSGVTTTFTTSVANTIYFNSLGTPVDATGTAIAGNQTVTVTYNGTRQITIDANTGRVSIL
mgnify:CR=1 FL=1